MLEGLILGAVPGVQGRYWQLKLISWLLYAIILYAEDLNYMLYFGRF